MSKKNQRVIWLARKPGAKENASINWTSSGVLFLDWISPQGERCWGEISPRLARLVAKRINEALMG